MTEQIDKVVNRVGDILKEKIIQVSIVSGILFYILAEPSVFAFVETLIKRLGKIININIELKGHNLLIFHSVVFSILMGFSIKYVFEPLFVKNGIFK